MYHKDRMPPIFKVYAALKGREANQWSHLLPGFLLRMTEKTASLHTLSFTFSAAGAATLGPV